LGGGISNSGTISLLASGKGSGGNGILVGGAGFSGSATTISTFAGGISNSGMISVSGGFGSNGIAVGNAAGFSGGGVTISAFSGGVTNSGTISVAAFAGSGILVGQAASSAAAVISTFAGGVSNSGTIVLTGPFGAAIAVANVSTFLGGITNTGTLSSSSGAGIVVVSVSSFFGNISNSGKIVAGSTGIFMCSCATMAGGSIINTGTITAGSGIVIDSNTPISIFNSGTIVATIGAAIDLTNASGGNTVTLGPGYSITGNVLGFGSDTLQLGGSGNGTFDLSSVGASQQYQGFTSFNVVSGTWTVLNTFGQTQAWNVNGGTLAGTGSLPAVNVNAGGTLEPGLIGVPGTVMTITNSLAFQPGSIYLINLGPTTASRVDVVNAGGTATLNGAVQGLLAPGSYSTKTTYVILDPPSISGKFTGYSSLNAPGFTGTLSYTASDVLLNLNASLGVGNGLNINQQNVATTINNFFNNGGTLPANFFPIFGLTGGNLGNALSQLSGEPATGTALVSSQMMTEFLTLMVDSSLAGEGSGGALPFAPERASLVSDAAALAYASVLKAPAKTRPPSLPSPTCGGGSGSGCWSAWGSAFGGNSRVNGDPVIGSNTVSAHDGGFAAGVDYRLSPDTLAGFSLAGGDTGWTLAQGLGTGRSDAFLAGGYGRSYLGPIYVIGTLAFADHWFSTNRTAMGDLIRASFNGQSFAGRLEAGDRFAVPLGTMLARIAPYGALQGQWFHTDAYAETDLTGGGLGLNFNAQNASDIRGELGARFEEFTVLGGAPLMLRGRLAWAHDWVSNPALGAVFQAPPGAAFTVNGAVPPKDSLLTSAGAELRFSPALSFSANFEGELAAAAQTYAGSGTIRYRW
jgi:uncharacterized protein with beta-barrel porin domain